MTPQKKQRLKIIGLSAASCTLGLGLLLYSLKENIMYFYTPSEILQFSQQPLKRIRLGGIVQNGSYHQLTVPLSHIFEVGDEYNAIVVKYKGLLPDLFREGQGVVVEGFLKDKIFMADQVLAKHDENYRPPQVKDKNPLKSTNIQKNGL